MPLAPHPVSIEQEKDDSLPVNVEDPEVPKPVSHITVQVDPAIHRKSGRVFGSYDDIEN
jgi:hypothetical protein